MRSLILHTCLLLTLASTTLLYAADAGVIEGFVRDHDTQATLVGTHVRLTGASAGTTTDLEGHFRIAGLAPGNYTLRFSHVGYEPVTRTDIIVRPDRITRVDADLTPIPYEAEEVSATPGYFAMGGAPRLSAVSFSAEEVRRAPGADGDVSRIMTSLPSVAKVNDQSNGLIVRGGSTLENAFFVDNIEIPNINHFPVQGSSSGPIGLINIDLVSEVRFSSGGFGAAFGDRLSSIMELEFREGNRDRFQGQLDLNIAGFGGVAEGPLGNSGSWLLSLRRSYLDLLAGMFDIGTTVAPRYGDVQWKVVMDADPENRLELLGIWSDDRNNPDSAAAVDNDMLYYGSEKILQRTAGLGWRTLWTHGYANTSLSVSSMSYRTRYRETGSNAPLLSNTSDETTVALRNVDHLRLSSGAALSFGIEGKAIVAAYDQRYGPAKDPLGGEVPGSAINSTLRRFQAGAFAYAEFSVTPALTATLGLRADRAPVHGTIELSPRLSAALRLSETTTLNAGLGMYRQSLPQLLQAQAGALPSLQAFHALLGVEHMLTASTRLTVEGYLKEYRHLPVDPSQPSLFVLDELHYNYGFFTYHGALEPTGRGRARGIEVVIQKRLAEEFYGLASASYSTSQYLNPGGRWTNRVCDNRVMIAAEGGYKPGSEWEFSARWIFAGGCPFTPFDMARSKAEQRGIFDEEAVNAERYPVYHSLNIRCDKRFHFTGSNLILYLSAWNVYGRKNVAAYFWKKLSNEQGTLYQWGVLPVFGLEYEF